MDNCTVNRNVKTFLEEQYACIQPNIDLFLKDDPVNVPGKFTQKEDIEISGFLTATIAWGQRKTIINNANKLVELMDHSPFDFIKNHKESDLIAMKNFVHRTFNSDDLLFFTHRLQRMYTEENGLEECMTRQSDQGLATMLSTFKTNFFDEGYLDRSTKHLANPLKKSTAKRLLMFLRWMVRTDLADFGIWKSIAPNQLLPPIDVHSAKYARAMGLLERKQNDWAAVQELGKNLTALCPEDPIKYDYVLYGMGAFSFFRPLSELRL